MGPDTLLGKMENKTIFMLLEGKSNWAVWKYKISILLRGVYGAMDLLDGKLEHPTELEKGASIEEKTQFESKLSNYLKIESNVLIILTANMTEETLQKIMRFTTARDVWMELHRLFDGVNEDKAYDLSMQFFSYKKDTNDDMASHLSKLKNLWNELKREILKENKECKCEIPELLLICKILATLSEEYFSFKSSWMLMAKNDRTIDNLTNHLCAYERALATNSQVSNDQEALLLKSANKVDLEKSNKYGKYSVICHYCKRTGHIVRFCKKWIADGRPPKSFNTKNVVENTEIVNENVDLTLMTVENSYLVETNVDDWFVDNGATSHVTNRNDKFIKFEKFDNIHGVTTADGTVVEAIGKGDIRCQSVINGKRKTFLLKNVWYTPKIQKNLFSVLAAQDMNERNSLFLSSARKCSLKIGEDEYLTGFRKCSGGLYKLEMKVMSPVHPIEINLVNNNNLLQLYHERLGHQNKRYIQKLIKKEFNITVPLDSELCEGCMYGKAHRLKFGTRPRATKSGELIHTDVCGPFKSSFSGFRYYVVFKDDFTRYRYVYFIKQKSEVSEKLKIMVAEAKVLGHNIREILSDNGGEFDNKIVKDILKKNGIRQRLTMPYSPQQNGSSERENRTIVEVARTLMYSHEILPEKLWAELINTATYILNYTGPTHIDGVSPYELWFGKKPTLKHLRIIGSTCFAHIPDQKRRKMEKKAEKGILIGYEGNFEGYRIWSKETGKLIRSRDVIFQEKQLKYNCYNDIERENDIDEKYNIDIDIERKNDIQQNVDNKSNIDNDTELINDNEVEKEMEELTGRSLRDRSMLNKPERYNDYIMLVEPKLMFSKLQEPETYTEAIYSSQRDFWKQAMENEMNSLKENNTWILQELPKGRKAIPCKWIYKVKMNPDGTVEKYKARLVIKGCSQKKGVDFDQTFSPVAKLGTIRSLLSVAANEGMILKQFDVSTAFLNGELEEEIYMKQPEGYNDGTNYVCRLKRSLYGLKQAPRCWNKRFSNFLIKQGFIRSDAESCLFIRKKNHTKLLIALYVDDGLVAATDEIEIKKLLQELETEFKITTKDATYYLGLEIEKKNDGSIKISQKSYAKKVLERFNMNNCKTALTPIVQENISSEEIQDEKKKSNEKIPYRQAVGALMYLMCGTRPDLAFAVGYVSRSLENPTEKDWCNVKRIFRYLQGTLDYGITYKNNFKKNLLECYSDADHGGDIKTRRSTTGVVCIYAGGVISWMSQQQKTVAISTTEAEIVAASEATKEIIWLKCLFKDMIEFESIPILKIDNESAVKLAKNPEFHRRTKHIHIRHFFVREKITEGVIQVEHVPSEFQLADLMTKPLFRIRLAKLCNDIGLTNN